MSASTAVILTAPAREPRVPRCPSTLITKPECHCRACLLELVSTHRTAAVGGAAPRAGAADQAGCLRGRGPARRRHGAGASAGRWHPVSAMDASDVVVAGAG